MVEEQQPRKRPGYSVNPYWREVVYWVSKETPLLGGVSEEIHGDQASVRIGLGVERA